MKEYRILKSTT
jgi:hypothetical protein